jgi:DNA-binding GntR family transcriptional regulator
VRKSLPIYRFEAKKTPWYKKRDVLAAKTGKPIRYASIGISGIFSDWTAHLRSLGFRATTENRTIEPVALPEDARDLFQLPLDKQFLKRARMTCANETPICTWDTYYPLEFVGEIADQIKEGTSGSIPEYIKEKHGIVIGYGEDKTTARMTTFAELNLFRLRTDDAAIVVHRVAYTKDRKTLVYYQEMILLASWFILEHEYPVDIWDK